MNEKQYLEQYPQLKYFEVGHDRELEYIGDEKPEYLTLVYHHMKQYKGKYQLTKARLGSKRYELMYAVRCKGGKIEPYSIIRGLLMCYKKFVGPEDTKRFIETVPDWVLVKARCYNEVVVVFPESRLGELEQVLSITPYTPMTESAKEAFRQRLKQKGTEQEDDTQEEEPSGPTEQDGITPENM